MLDALLTIFIIIGVGLLARHLGAVRSPDYQRFNSFIYHVTLPALIFISLYDAGYGAFGDAALLLSNAAVILLMMALMLLAYLALRIPRKLMGVLFITAFYGNIVYMGYPVVELTFGQQGIPIVVAIATVYNLIIFSLGIALLQYCSDSTNLGEIPRHLARNPLLVSSVIGIAYLYLSLPILPGALETSVRLLGQLTAPLALFSLGVFMHGRNPLVNLKLNLAIAALKMAFFPALFIAVAGLLGLKGLGFQVSLVESAMPLAVTNFILADQYKLDAALVSSAIVLTTLLSPLSLLAVGAL